jgi:hypothetical protein
VSVANEGVIVPGRDTKFLEDPVLKHGLSKERSLHTVGRAGVSHSSTIVFAADLQSFPQQWAAGARVFVLNSSAVLHANKELRELLRDCEQSDPRLFFLAVHSFLALSLRTWLIV